MTTKEYFPGIGKIPFEGKESKNPMAFHYYNAEKVIRGKKMKDWLRFSMAWWHTLCAEGGDQFGGGTKRFPWNVASSPIQRAKDKMDAGFEFMQKCGIGYYCFHDTDLGPLPLPAEILYKRRYDGICERIEGYEKKYSGLYDGSPEERYHRYGTVWPGGNSKSQ